MVLPCSNYRKMIFWGEGSLRHGQQEEIADDQCRGPLAHGVAFIPEELGGHRERRTGLDKPSQGGGLSLAVHTAFDRVAPKAEAAVHVAGLRV